MRSVLRAPKNFAKYAKAALEGTSIDNEDNFTMNEAVLRDPRDFKDFKANNPFSSDDDDLALDKPLAKAVIDTIQLNQDVDLSILSEIWVKTVLPAELDQLVDHLIKVYESNFIGEWEYKRRRAEIESLLPSNHIHRLQDEAQYAGSSDSVVFIKDGERSARGIPTDTRATTKQKDNVVRVFLSSTFRDMQPEREQLIKQAFPVLRATCAARGLIFKEVDLRWGITEEQATKGDILDICLTEIDLCRPYFVNFVGSRYGWVPTEFPKSVVAKFPFLANVTPGTKSVTEIEVMYGALNNTSAASGAFFFLKNENNTDAQDETEAVRLADLRKKIRGSGLPCKNYSTPEEFAKQVSQSLLAAIERDFSRASAELQEDELAASIRLHTLHSMNKRRIYVGRVSISSFRSSLLSNWFYGPTRRGSEAKLIHHVGCGAEATDCVSMLRRIMSFMKKEFNWEEEITNDPKSIQRDFGRWLKTATRGQRLLLVIDGIDQLVDVDAAHTLAWLPEIIPGNVKVIISSAAGHPCSKVLSKRYSKNLVVKGLSTTEKEILAVEYLRAYGKTLSHSQLQSICKEPQTSNPLYLRCLLEELRVFGVFEEVDQLVEHYLRARQPSQLLEKILGRLEKDYGQEYPGIVKDVFCLVWASNSGLSEQELIEVLQVPPLALSSLLCAARELFTHQNGHLSLFHDALRQAVQVRYLEHEDLVRKYHLLLANYFEKLPTEVSNISKRLSRKAEELPYHLLKSSQWYRLKQCLADIPIFEEWFTKRSRFDLKRFWLTLGEHYSVALTYTQALAEYEEVYNPGPISLIHTTLRVSRFLKEMLQYGPAATLLERCLSICDPSNSELRSKIYYRIAQIYWNQGLWEQAEPPCLESLRLRQQLFGERNLLVAKCLCGLGELYVTRDQKKAEGYLNRSLEIREALLGKHHLVSRLYHDIAVVKDFYGLHDEAIDLHRRAIKIREDTLGADNPQLAVSWESLGTTQKLAGKYREAESSMQKALAINIAVHGEINPSVASSLEWLAMIYDDMKQHVKAAEYHDRSDKILAQLRDLGLDIVERVVD